jgi:hypothetical protein
MRTCPCWAVRLTLAAGAYGTYTLDLSTDQNTGTDLVTNTPSFEP